MIHLEWSDIIYYARSAVQIALISVLVYILLRALERISAGGKLKGLSLALGVIVLAWIAARELQLHAIVWLLQAGIGVSALLLAVVFQPELRRLFTRLGGIFPNQDLSANTSALHDILAAVRQMSERRIGALIVFERNDRLDDYVNTNRLDCEITPKSLVALFWKDSPLHDGAMIVRAGRVAAAGVILPLTNDPAFKDLSGTRHRAGIGISEDTDALALIVSEETGQISLADRGAFTRGLSLDQIAERLTEAFRTGTSRLQHVESHKHTTNHHTTGIRMRPEPPQDREERP
jgi:diadenylate cyclase